MIPIKQHHQQELEKTVTNLLLGDAEHGGVPVRVVASMVGVSPTTVMKIKRELNAALESENITYDSVGVDGKRRPGIRADNSVRDERIRASYENGYSMRKVADHFGVSVGTVHRVVNA